MSVVDIVNMVAWALTQIGELVAPKSGAVLAAEKVVQALAHIYQAVQDVTYGLATPVVAQAAAQDLLDKIKANDQAADDAANQLP